MKIDCKIIQDLLPLYVDDVCSSESKTLVSNHLHECKECKQIYDNMTGLMIEDEDRDYQEIIESKTENYNIKRSFKKIKYKWIASILCVALIIPIFGLGVMVRNEVKKEGLCFSNLDEIHTIKGMFKAMQKKDYEKVFSYYDLKERYNSIINPDAVVEDFVFFDVDFNGTTWKVQEEYLKYYMTESDFINFVLSNSNENIMIPVEIWEKIINNEAIEEEVLIELKQYYTLVHTSWGDFYMSESYVYNNNLDDGTFEEGHIALILYGRMSAVPEEIYESAMVTRAQYDQETEAVLQLYRDMGYDGFYEYKRTSFLHYAEEFDKKNISITDISFDDAYMVGDEWRIVIEITLRDSSGNTGKMQVDTSFDDEGIYIGASTRMSEHEEMQDAFMNVVALRNVRELYE